ncbi:MAG: respiratory nitrate reductase subunit gamma [Gammaproteobacteria bacterium]|nr:respiratory nitrate reductase subunit gamma [Gammaproteobacteria bacterium]
MTALSWAYVIMFYLAMLILFVGVTRKIIQYARTPAPLKIPTTPAPTTKAGVVWRMITEVVLFNSLFKANRWIWIFGWLFHFALLLAFFRHLRYALAPDSIFWPLVNNWLVLNAGKYGAYAMLIGLLGLLARRFLVDRVRYISSPSDYLMLVLILGIAGSGMYMSFISRVDILELREFVLGLFYFAWQPLPSDAVLLTHLSLVLILMVIFPVSKLLHAPGVFFSPTRNQVDNPREQRHLAAWARRLETGTTS